MQRPRGRKRMESIGIAVAHGRRGAASIARTTALSLTLEWKDPPQLEAAGLLRFAGIVERRGGGAV
ncbi:hypothetical protein GCM10010533_28350 [Mycolicibacterium pallens]